MKTSSDTTTPFDDFQILDSKLHVVPIVHLVPAGYEKYIIPGSTVYSATGQPGVFLFQEIAFPRYSFWISHYFSRSRKKVIGLLPQPSLELHFILLGDVLYRLKGFDWQPLKETQYNLLSIPQIKNEVYFEAKDYITFDIHPTPALLEKLSARNSRLAQFLKLVREGRYVQYYQAHQFASAPILYRIKQIFEHLSGTTDIVADLDHIVERLIKLALTAPLGKGQTHFSYYDIEKLYNAERQMIQFLDEEDIINQQIQKAAMRVSKFREGFLQIFGELPHLYLLRHRMEKARSLLFSRKHSSIKDIARRVGYSNPNSFTVVYRNFFGISPEKDRERRH